MDKQKNSFYWELILVACLYGYSIYAIFYYIAYPVAHGVYRAFEAIFLGRW